MDAPVRHYRLLADRLPAEEKRIRTLYTPTLLLAILLPSIAFVILGWRNGLGTKPIVEFSAVVGLLMVVLVIWQPRRMKVRLVSVWNSYDLEIGHDYLIRRQADLPDLRIPFERIQQIERVPGRYLRLTGTPTNNVATIPEGIEGFDEVVALLSSIQPTRSVRTPQWLKYRIFMVMGMILFMLMLWANSPSIVIPLSLVVSGLIVWTIWWYQRNPNIPSKSKWVSWLYLLFLPVCAMKLLVALFP